MTTNQTGETRQDGAAAPTQYCKVLREGPLTIVKINRPDCLNALHTDAHFELARVFDEFAADPEQWIAIITGEGRAFSAGNDLKFQAKGGGLDRPDSDFGGLTGRFDCEKPIIAAVNGLALGGGCEIALSCDIVIASDDAIFALPEPRVGMAALASGLHRLPRTIGWQQAMGMILTGRRVSAHEAREMGFVNSVVSPEELIAEARRWAEMILQGSPLAIRAAKSIARKGLEKASLEQAFLSQRDNEALDVMLGSEEYREGPKAFAEKRQPIWKGR
ncbi:enoyl-CoA hydratase-related protein [uncultured Croceicoccus sp.]|uniref:enoyl-CoA hydratase-related protein n=1 Tax=uncultured Croceicoccus sp. TaxID=1295329 RepID=UPI0026095F99|nr:enoyl-CoA hydratase-related protein [uncultured Croceicoccus sp.]